MPLPDLCLLPHEAGDLAPGELLCAPAIARVKLGDGRHYLGRRSNSRVHQAELLVRREASSLAPLMRFWADNCKIEQINEELKQGAFRRLLLFDADVRLMRSTDKWHYSLEMFGRGNWSNWRNFSNHRSVFQWQEISTETSALWWAALEDDEVERRLKTMLNDEDSGFSFAHRWLGLREADKQKLVILNSREEMRFLSKLLCAASGKNLLLSTETGWIWFVSLHPLVFETATFVAPITRGWIATKSGRTDFSLNQKKLLDIISANFELRINRELAIKCIKGHMSKKAGMHFMVPVRAPSAHELLEFQLLLRDFLRDKVTPAELAGLMNDS